MSEIEIVVPQVGEAVAEVILRAWLKGEGDAVRRGEPLFEVDTDKAVVEVEAHSDGVLNRILAPAGSAVMPQQVVALLTPVGAESAVVEDGRPPTDDRRPQPDDRRPPTVDVSPVAARMAAELGIDLAAVKGTGPGGRIVAADVKAAAERQLAAANTAAPAPPAKRPPVAPKARRLAQELGIDLARVTGTGPDGMITAEDVEAAANTSPPTPLLAGEERATPPSFAGKQAGASGVIEPLSRLRQAIAERMTAAKQQAPHFYLLAEVEMTQAQRLRSFVQATAPSGQPPTYTDLIVRAAALALRAMPGLNVAYADGGRLHRNSVDIGVAVALEDGLIVPVIRGADGLSLAQTSAAIRAAVERGRSGRLRPDDLGDKSLTISNLGMYGIDAFIAILDQPAAMILAVGRVADRVVAVNGQPAVRPMCTLTLSVDHRVLDGAQAAGFLMLVKRHLEEPYSLMAA